MEKKEESAVQTKTYTTQMIVIGAVCACVGIGIWIYQLFAGLGVTGITQNYIWGLYIAAFYLCAAVGAGSLLIGGIEALRTGKSQPGIMATSIAAHISAGFLIGIDTGTIGNMWALVTNPKFSSSIVQDFWCLFAGFVLAIIGFVFAYRQKSVSKPLAIVFIIVPFLLMIIEGAMLSAMPAHAFWGTGTIASFVFAMLIAACAIGLLFKVETKVCRWGLVAIASLAMLITVFDLFGQMALGHDVGVLFFGELGGSFFIYLIVGVLVPVIAMLCKGLPRWASLTGAICALVGLVAEKFWVLNSGFTDPLIQLSSYGTPSITVVELFGAIGLVGTALLVYGLLMLLMQKSAQGTSDEKVSLEVDTSNATGAVA